MSQRRGPVWVWLARSRGAIGRISLWIAFLVVGYAALRFPNALVTSLAESVVYLLVIVAIMMTIYGQRQTRAFWIGGLITGLLFFSLAKGALPLFAYRPLFVTSQLNGQLFAAMFPEQWVQAGFNPYSASPFDMYVFDSSPRSGASSRYSPYVYSPSAPVFYPSMPATAPAFTTTKSVDTAAFVRICDSLWAILLAALGGTAARALQRRSALGAT